MNKHHAHTSPATATATAGSPILQNDDRARRLNQACGRGDLIGAFRTVRGLETREAASILTAAGFAVTDWQQRERFWSFVQRQLAAACSLQLNGFDFSLRVF